MCDLAGSARPTSTRRSPHAVRELLLASARHCFATRGYTGASTRDIATRAGVAENTIYRHFGSKAGIFRATIVEPLAAVLTSFVDRWEQREAGATPAPVLVTDWVSSLYDLLREHHDAVVALIAAHAFDTDAAAVDAPVLDALAGPLGRLEQFTRREMQARGFIGDAAVINRCAVGMVTAMAVVDDWFPRAGGRPFPRDLVVEQISALLLHGITGAGGDG